MLKNEPQAVVNAIREIMKNSAQAAQDEQQVATEKLGEKYKTMKPVEEKLVGKQHKLDKNKNGKLDAHDFKLLRKEEAETEIRDEKTKAVLKRARDVHGKDVEIMGKVADMMRKEKEKKLAKEEVEHGEPTHAVTFTRGKVVGARSHKMFDVVADNEDHAVKVAKKQFKDKFPNEKHSQFHVSRVHAYKSNQYEEVEQVEEGRFKKGEDVGKPGMMFGKIAAKAAKKYGSKEAGQRVAGAVLKKVLAKKAMKEELELEEGRGRPRKNPPKPAADDGHEYGGQDNAKEPDQHIHVRLGAAADQDKGADHKFDNGKTHKITQSVAKVVYNGLNKMKPDVRAKLHDHIQKSHENLMQVHTMLAGKK